jgi:O-antigen/teichoic acid export membrane protein
MRQVYLYSFPIFLMSIGGFAALEIDTIMLKYLRTAYDTGIYSAAKNIVMFLPHISLALSMGIVPGLSVFDAHTALTKRRFYYQVLGGIAGIYLLIGLGVVVFAMFGLGLFFSPEYQAASTPLLVLSPFVVLTGVSTYCGNLLDYRGLAWTRSINFGLTIVANVLLNWWLIPKWGAVGAAAASSIAFAPYCILNLWQAHRAFSAGESNQE